MTGIVCSMVGATFSVAAAATIIRSKKGITAYGNAQVDTAQSKFGGSSLLLDGAGDYLLVGDDSQFNIGSGDFTVEAWVRFNALPEYFFIVCGDPSPGFFFGFAGYTGNVGYGRSGTAWDYLPSVSLSTGSWTHWAVSRSGTSIKIFKDGTQVGTTQTSSQSYDFSPTRLAIGCEYNNGSPHFYLNGWIDELRISNSARYTTTFTPSTTPFVNDDNTLLLMHANSTDASTFFEDDNGVRSQNSLISYNGASVSTSQSKFGGSSGTFTKASSHYLGVVDPGSTLTFTGDYTVECWFRLNGSPTFNSNNVFWNASDHLFYLACYNTNFYELDLFTGGQNRVTTYSGGNLSLSANTWYHVAFVRNGTTTKIYLDGVEKGSGTWNYSIGSGGIYEICGSPTYGYTNWYVDEFRISDNARYTSNFTPSTTPFVNDANTKLLVHMDGTNGQTVFRDDNGYSQRAAKYISYYGNAQIDTAQSKFGDSSALFDGTGDWLTTGAQSDLNFGTNDFTIEFWIRPSVLNNDTMVIGSGVGSWGSGALGIAGGTSSYGMRFFSYDYNSSGSGLVKDPSAMTTNTWYHYALVRSGNNWTLYRDGTSVSTATWSGSVNFNGNSNTYIGYAGWGGVAMNGWIDEFRISNTARYSANFTAPTAPFTNDTNTLLLMHMGGADAATTFVDDNGGRSSKSIQANGNAVISTSQSKFGLSSAYFDGSGDYITVNKPFNFGTNDFTLEFWMNPTSRATSYAAIVCNYADGSFTTNSWGLFDRHDAVPTKITLWSYNINSAASAVLTSTTSISNGTWYHIAMVRSGTSLKLYVNGTEESSTTTSASFDGSADKNFFAGIANASGTEYNGYIDELRISNTARYTTTFTPSTTPFQNDANTVLLIHADGTNNSTVFIDDNGQVPHTA